MKTYCYDLRLVWTSGCFWHDRSLQGCSAERKRYHQSLNFFQGDTICWGRTFCEVGYQDWGLLHSGRQGVGRPYRESRSKRGQTLWRSLLKIELGDCSVGKGKLCVYQLRFKFGDAFMLKSDKFKSGAKFRIDGILAERFKMWQLFVLCDTGKIFVS